MFESHGKQIVVESNGTIIIGPSAGSANGNGNGAYPAAAPRETAEAEYLTGEFVFPCAAHVYGHWGSP